MLVPPTWLGEWVNLIVVVVGALSTVAAAVLLPIYFRRLHGEAAQAKLHQVQTDTITALQAEVSTVRRMLDHHVTNVAECEKRLKAAEKALAKWDEMLGRVWLHEFGDE